MTAPGKIAVLGAGPVGRTLAAGWASAGYHVVLGSRDPGSDRITAVVAELGATASAAGHTQAVRDADIAVIAVPGDQVPTLIGQLGDALADRVTIDTTNILTPGAPILHHADALRAAGARVYRAFNSMGVEQMARPLFGSIRADMLYAGPDTTDRERVHQLIEALGFRAVWLGDDAPAFALTDELARLWFQLVFQRGWDRRLGLRLLTGEDERNDI